MRNASTSVRAEDESPEEHSVRSPTRGAVRRDSQRISSQDSRGSTASLVDDLTRTWDSFQQRAGIKIVEEAMAWACSRL